MVDTSNGTVSGRDWRRLFRSTGRPPQWMLASHLAIGLCAGAVCGLWLTPERGAILAGLAAGAVAAVGAAVPAALTVRASAAAVLVTVVAASVAFATTTHPWWAAAAMAAAAMATSLAAGTGPVGAAFGTIGTLVYVLVAALGVVDDLVPSVSLGSGVARIAIGAVAGLAVSAVSATVRKRHGTADTANTTAAPRTTALGPGMLRSLRSFDEHARDGVRRAVPLAIGIYLFERSAGRDALWVFLAAFVVLLPTGKTPHTVALARVASTVLGVVLLGLLSLVVPHQVLFTAAFVLLFLGITYTKTYPVPAGALTAMGAILLAGTPTGAIGHWAGHRLLDTVVGCALALAATYLLWPHDKPDDDLQPVPATST